MSSHAFLPSVLGALKILGRRLLLAVLKDHDGTYERRLPLRYAEPRLSRTLYVTASTLNCTQKAIGSQGRFWITRVMCFWMQSAVSVRAACNTHPLEPFKIGSHDKNPLMGHPCMALNMNSKDKTLGFTSHYSLQKKIRMLLQVIFTTF